MSQLPAWPEHRQHPEPATQATLPVPAMREVRASLSAQAGPDTDTPPCFASSELMRGHRTIAIRHNGITYRLQATRQGKLILTK